MEYQSSLRRRLSLVERISKHWLGMFLVVFGLWNIVPFLAPVLMKVGWESGGKAVYTAYAPFCHQMAQRSFFFFGEKIMYNADELPVAAGGTTADALIFRQYKGDPQFGWKVAWSDRMVYMYGSVWLMALLYAWRRRYRQPRPISLVAFGVLLLPMVIDGGTHALSDLGGLSGGFRYTNHWLATLTGHLLPEWFYVGDSLGSFNAWMRLLSGITFGMACVWLAFPYIDRGMQATEQQINERYVRLDELEEHLNAEREKLLAQHKP
jgi:uncharacterized membrane protein